MSVSADALEQYMILVYAGLTGSVTMITCTVLALTRLVFEYKGRLETFNNFPHLLLNARIPESADSVRCPVFPRRHRGDHQRAAAAQRLSAAVVSYQRDRQSLSELHQGHPLHHGRQDASVTRHRHGRHKHYR